MFSRRAWLGLIIGFALAYAAGSVFALAVQRAGGWNGGTRWDVELLRRAHVALPGWLDALLLSVPWLGTNITVFAVIIPVSFWLRRRRRPDIIAQLCAPVAGSYLLNLLLKFAFGRPRPSLFPRRGEYTWASYPSGHMITAVSVLLFIAWLLHREKGWIWPYLLWLPLFVALTFSRLYLGVHWPTDVVGGFVTGVIWFVAVWLVFRRPDWRGGRLKRAAPGMIIPSTSALPSETFDE